MKKLQRLKILKEISEPINQENTDLMKKISMTAMTGKGAENAKEHLSEIIVKAISSIIEQKNGNLQIDKDNIKIEKKTHKLLFRFWEKQKQMNRS